MITQAQWAIDTIAQHLVARVVETAIEGEWDFYPEIGEYDWERVVASALAQASWPTGENFTEAYTYLERRASCTPQ